MARQRCRQGLYRCFTAVSLLSHVNVRTCGTPPFSKSLSRTRSAPSRARVHRASASSTPSLRLWTALTSAGRAEAEPHTAPSVSAPSAGGSPPDSTAIGAAPSTKPRGAPSSHTISRLARPADALKYAARWQQYYSDCTFTPQINSRSRKYSFARGVCALGVHACSASAAPASTRRSVNLF